MYKTTEIDGPEKGRLVILLLIPAFIIVVLHGI